MQIEQNYDHLIILLEEVTFLSEQIIYGISIDVTRLNIWISNSRHHRRVQQEDYFVESGFIYQ